MLGKGLPYVEHLECPERQWARTKRVPWRKSLALANQRRYVPRQKLCRLGGKHRCRYGNWKSRQRFEFCFIRLAREYDQTKCTHCCMCVCFQDAKKSRLPILIKPSRSVGSVYQLPATQEVMAQLQGQILELQGELKEFKTCNKQLHQKLILAEAMMEERPAPDKTLLKGKHLGKMYSP